MDKVMKKLDEMDQKFGQMSKKLDSHTTQLNSITVEVSSITEKQSSHSGALTRIESVMEGYADAYKINKGNIDRHEKRLSTVEEKLDITPNPELVIVE